MVSVTKPPGHWAGMSAGERTDTVRELGLPTYRADQLSRHYFERHEADPTTWSDLPVAQRDLVATVFPSLAEKVTEFSADQGMTVKSLYRLFGGALVECVLMRYPRVERSGFRSTLCVSCQAGCGIGCPFCATGQAGLQRNLTAAEILEQVRMAVVAVEGGTLPGGAGNLNNVVFMGMGEPLANYQAVMAAIRAISAPSPHGFAVSARGITVSTAGLVPRMADLAKEGLPLTLAVSLHAPDDELRDTLVPINKRWPVREVLDAASSYFRETGRRVSIEYALMRDINDQAERADLLARELNARGLGWV
ncbi:MAG: radical SAM protein, partial [Propionibacteriaceae bacterium]|nr:radical SAM protein [Propionibacteriaceae bacterium]